MSYFKIMKFRLLLILIFLFFVASLYTSCTSAKNFVEVPESKLTITSIKQLSGQFKNREETSSGFSTSLWAQVVPFYRDSISDWTNIVVELIVDNKFLNFSLLKDTVVLKAIKCKYKLENGFVVFRKNRLQGIPLLFYRYQKRKNILTLDKQNNLKIHLRGSSEGGIFIFIFGSPIIEDYKFSRVK